MIAFAGELSGGDREQGTADAVAHRVDLDVWNDRTHGVHGITDAFVVVVIHAEIAIVRVRVLPRDHEDRVALVDQITHQGIPRRQIEDVIFHYPGRDDQYRFRVHARCGRRVLNDLDQFVPVHNLARRDRDVPAYPERFTACGRLVLERRVDVFEPVLEPGHEILS